MGNPAAESDVTKFSRRTLLAAQGAAFGSLIVPDTLLAALNAATHPMPRLDTWAQVKRQFELAPDWLHFSGFFLTSHPKPVRDVIEGFRRAIDRNPYLSVEKGVFGTGAENLYAQVQVEAAEYLGGKPKDVAITSNTTTGLALIYQGLPLKRGEEVLTTTHDHFVHHTSIRLACERSGASWRKVPLFSEAAMASTDEILKSLRTAIRPETRVLGLTWVHSQSGIRLPVRRISQLVAEVNANRAPREHLLIVLDGVHGLGAVDESAAELGVDYFASGTHKWIFAPRGTGVVWARPGRWEALRPLIPSMIDREGFQAWAEDRAERTPSGADRMTPGGFQAFEHHWAMVAAFRMHRAMGRARVARRLEELNGQLKARLVTIPGLVLHTPRSPELSAAICCFELSGQNPEETVRKLVARKVAASTSPYARPLARLSASLFNTPAEVEQAVAAVRAIVA
jgi:isopenicillin-N epimerase